MLTDGCARALTWAHHVALRVARVPHWTSTGALQLRRGWGLDRELVPPFALCCVVRRARSRTRIFEFEQLEHESDRDRDRKPKRAYANALALTLRSARMRSTCATLHTLAIQLA